MSYSSNFFQADINSIIILIAVIHLLPNIASTYLGPQLIKAAKNDDLVRNFCVLIGIILLVQISNIQDNKFEIAGLLFLFLLIFSRQTLEFNMIQIVLALYIFSKYNENDDIESLKKYMYLFIVLLLLGYGYYFRKQFNEKGLKFSLKKFILGKREKDYGFEYVDFEGL